MMVGSLAANLHEGSRSEYLAHYAFASFGTAIPVPHQEDSGIDLYCTLTERVGQRLWPRAHYTVQVKSTSDPWIFDGLESVRWFVRHPLPLFLCIVDKAALLLRVYPTSPRFYLWTLPPLPPYAEIVPGDESIGRPVHWSEGNRFSVNAPILRAKISDLHDPDAHARLRSTLEFWIDQDRRNLERISAGLNEFLLPHDYETNVDRPKGGWGGQGIIHAPDIQPAVRHLGIVLSWLTNQLSARGDMAGAARGALLLRHLFPYKENNYDPDYGATEVQGVQRALNTLLGEDRYVFAGVDALAKVLDAHLNGGSTGNRTDLAG